MRYLQNKNIFLIVALIICNLGFSQTSEGIVIYKKNFIETETQNNNKFMLKQMKALSPEFDKMRFTLKFSKNESLFEIEETIRFEENIRFKLASSIGGSKGSFYFNLIDKEVINKKEAFGGQFLVTSNISNIKWQTHNETKKIGNYVCYKATTIKVVKNSKGTFNHPVTAWYTLQIPIGFGPIGYGGLPGLIVELSVQNIKYSISKVVLNPKKKVVIKKPTKGKVVTKEEFNAIGKEAMGNFKSRTPN